MKKCLLVIWLIAIASGAFAADPIKIEDLFRRPAYAQLRLSPDGTKLAALVPLNNRANLAIIDLKTMTSHVVTNFIQDDVQSYEWLSNDRIHFVVANLADATDEVRIKRNATMKTDGTQERKQPGRIIHKFYDEDGTMVLVGPIRDRQSPDAFRWNPRTDRQELLTFENPGSVRIWIVDHQGRVRAAFARDRDTLKESLHYRARGEGPWKKLGEWEEGGNPIVPLAFDVDDKTLLVSYRQTGDRSAVLRYDPDQGKLLDVVHQSERFDASGVVFDRARRKLIAIRRGDDTTIWLDDEWRELQRGINTALPETADRGNALSWGALNTDRVLVTAASAVKPPSFHLLDRASGRLERIVAATTIGDAALSSRKSVSYKARDGLTIPAMLTLPKGSDGKNLPLVVEIHGGPFVPGFQPGFNLHAQFFASRGYAVLQPNYRGTLGYGRKFEEAGYLQWGRAMQDDITDGVKWAIAEGIADASRVCLFGGSYGGYATLMGLIREPQMFKCGVSFVAVTDLDLLFDPGWDVSALLGGEGVQAWKRRRIGDPSDREAIRNASPVHQVQQIQAPLLLAFGGVDDRIPLAHPQRLKSALERHNKKFEWVMYPDEGHGFNAEKNKFDFYRRVEAFLAQHLKQ